LLEKLRDLDVFIDNVSGLYNPPRLNDDRVNRPRWKQFFHWTTSKKLLHIKSRHTTQSAKLICLQIS